jgi:hypothetical protein
MWHARRRRKPQTAPAEKAKETTLQILEYMGG